MKALLSTGLLAAAVTLHAFAQSVPAQPPNSPDEVTIKVDVSLVNVFCSVRDRNGRYITDLQADQFEVRENGKPQTIRYFGLVKDLPLTIGLLVDVSRSQENLLQVEREAAEQFFHQVLGKKDMAFIISFGVETELLQDLTNSPLLLRAGLDGLRLNAGAAPVFTPTTVPSPSASRGTVLYEAVWLAAKEKLQREVGRKVLVLISDGVDVGSRITEGEAIREAQKADAVIYSILYYDPRYQHGFGPSGSGVLTKLSEQTGGRKFEVSRKRTLSSIFEEIQEEMRSQYLIGYAPADPPTKEEFRQIEVRTKPQQYKVQARKGYYASPAP